MTPETFNDVEFLLDTTLPAMRSPRKVLPARA